MDSRKQYLELMAKDQSIVNLVKEHNLTKEDIDNNYNILLAYYFKKAKCSNCKKLDNCKQNHIGYYPSIDYNGCQMEINYLPCSYKQKELDILEKSKNLECYSCNINNFDLDDFYINEARKLVLQEVKECINNIKNSIPTKGLFLHGKYGCGKTYILAYLARNLANNGHKVILAYYPDLVRILKSSITNGNLEPIVEKLKEVEVLILDDFGGEVMTSFIRDEVLGVILQDRMVNNRLTFMSSNLDEKSLVEHLKESNKDVDNLRASRIYERMRSLMKFIELNDQNYRN